MFLSWDCADVHPKLTEDPSQAYLSLLWNKKHFLLLCRMSEKNKWRQEQKMAAVGSLPCWFHPWKSGEGTVNLYDFCWRFLVLFSDSPMSFGGSSGAVSPQVSLWIFTTFVDDFLFCLVIHLYHLEVHQELFRPTFLCDTFTTFVDDFLFCSVIHVCRLEVLQELFCPRFLCESFTTFFAISFPV